MVPIIPLDHSCFEHPIQGIKSIFRIVKEGMIFALGIVLSPAILDDVHVTAPGKESQLPVQTVF